MSRAYNLKLETKGLKLSEIKKVVIEKFGWQSVDNGEYEEVIYFEVEGSLYGGTSEEEAHKEIYKALKKINSKAKIKTIWTHLEYEEMGDEID